MRTVLSLCDRTGNMLKPWADAGYRCIAVDLQHEADVTLRDGIHYVRGDVLDWFAPLADYAACFAFPPCTDLASSGARWFKEKGLRSAIDAFTLVERCRRICEWTGAPYLIENPIGTLSTYWRDPDFIFDPYEFAAYEDPPKDTYTKRTCIWTGGGSACL